MVNKFITIVTVILVISISIPIMAKEPLKKSSPEMTADYVCRGRLVENNSGNIFAVVNISNTTNPKNKYKTVRVSWDSSNFDLYNYIVDGSEQSKSNITETDNEIILYLSPKDTLQLRLIYKLIGKMKENCRFSFKLVSSEQVTTQKSKTPLLKSFHTKLSLSGEPEKVENGEVIDGVSLSPNIPNPFNSRTEVKYFLPNEGDVKISIFDVFGREVRVLLDGERGGGTHKVTWEGTDSNNKLVPSGIYFLKISGDGFSKNTRMHFIR